MEAVGEIHTLTAEAPIELGTVLLPELLGLEGVDVVACRTMKRA